MTRILLSIILLSLLFACKNDEKALVPTIKLGNIEKLEPVDYLSLFKPATFIPLETNQDCLIGSITDIVVHDDMIYILDYKARRVLAFNDQGKFIGQIGSKGRGPQEYGRPFDIFYSEYDDCLKIYDRQKKTILCFSKDGEFLREVKIPVYCRKIVETADAYYAYTGAEPYGRGMNTKGVKFFKLSKQGKTVKEIIGEVGTTQGLGGPICVNPVSGNMLFTEGLNYNIYTLVNDEIQKKLTIDFGNKSYPEGTVAKINKMNARKLPMELGNADYVSSIDFVLQTDDHVLLSYLFKHRGYTALYSISQQKLICEFPTFTRAANGADTMTNPIAVADGGIYESITAMNLIYMRDKQKNSPARQEALNLLCSSINEESNPVIVRHVIK
ncbi:6-bladed beta-propeller [Puteibacter caeruleilacunae]|nr:6-bladed beta-propeller [Puteibacter caeruleilacunae]